MIARVRLMALAAGLALPAAAAAQSKPSPALLESYARVIALRSYMTTHVGELLLACGTRGVLTDEEVEARYQAYRKRNAALLGRAEAWSKEAEQRLAAQGEERAARRLAEESDLTAMAAASARAQGVIGKARDARAACAAMGAAIESGRYDLSGNAEFVELLR
ncbi:MAG: hypothetical protein AB1452_02615 [Pseudomonadota bacterium]